MTLPCSKKKGFTLIELLVGVTIIMVLTGIGVASYNNFHKKRILEKAAEDLRSNLRLAQSKALNNEKPSDCGDNALDGWWVKDIMTAGYRFYYQCSGSEVAYGDTIYLGSGLNETSFNVFFKSLGGTNLSADLNIIITDGTNTAIIAVNTSGDIK